MMKVVEFKHYYLAWQEISMAPCFAGNRESSMHAFQ
jgi:hypothetical protein